MQKSIFVGNIPFGAMEREIKELFSQYGEVSNVNFIMDWANGRFKGYGFVTMPGPDAERAIAQLNEHKFQDRKLIVSPAKAAD